MPHSTYENLVMVAATLFRQQGYSASSITDILDAANTAKGSLYHHFPGGKQDLAIAAARHCSQRLLELMAQCFDKARAEETGFSGGVQYLIEDIALLFDEREGHTLSPVAAALLNGVAKESFHKEADRIFSEWQAAFVSEAEGFGLPLNKAQYQGKKLLLLMEGAWILARAAGHAGPIRDVGTIMREEGL